MIMITLPIILILLREMTTIVESDLFLRLSLKTLVEVTTIALN
jgi:hypothetical protein